MAGNEREPEQAVVIRHITSGDHDFILAMNEEATPAVSKASADHMAWLISVSCYPRVATVDGEVVAFLLGLPPGVEYSSENYRWFVSRYRNFVYVDRVVVSVGARGSGVGKTFYEDLVEFSRARAPVILCEVNVKPRNDGSLRFHTRFGFEEVGQQDTEGGVKRVSLLAKQL